MLSIVKCLDSFNDSIGVRRFYILRCSEKLTSCALIESCCKILVAYPITTYAMGSARQRCQILDTGY